MASDETEVVSLLRSAVRDKVGKERTELWLCNGEALHIDGGAVVVTAADQFTLDRIRRNLRNELQDAAHKVLGGHPPILFRVDDALKHGATRGARRKAAPAADSRQRLLPFESDGSHAAGPPRCASPPAAPPHPRSGEPHHDRPPSPGRRFARLDTFVTGDGVCLAQAAALKAAQKPGEISPLFLHGPTGCGKTHLAEGIWSAARRAGSRHCVFLAAEQFTTMFLESLQGQGMPSFRNKVRQADLLIIDDIQFLHGKRATLHELLNTVEYFHRERRQLVLTADRPPAELPSLGAELVARLSNGLVADLPPLDEAARRGVLQQQLTARGLHLGQEVLELLARELPGDGRRLQGALNRLQAMHEATGRPITAGLARETLKDLRPPRKLIRLIDIDQAVCEVFGLPPKSLYGDARCRAITQPRALALVLACKHTRAALTEISQHFGLRSHSTVIAARKKVAAWRQQQVCLGLLDGRCDVEQALSKVEALLTRTA